MRRLRLEFVVGSRCLASLWIVCGHFLAHSERGFMLKALWRANCAVDFFVILSGFVSHWASRGSFVKARQEGAWLARTKVWLARRFGRVLLSTYLALVVSVGLLAAAGRRRDIAPGHVGRCALLIEGWLDPGRWCPNGQMWTVMALAPSWLLYPTLFDFAVFERSTRTLAVLFCVLSLGPTLATLTMLWRSPDHHNLTQSEKNSLYIWPPGMISDFALGVVAAELAASHKLILRRPGLLADACVLVVFCAVVFAPNPAYEYRGGFEPLFDHALAPFFALFLTSAATDCLETTARGESPCSFAARLFSHSALCKIGESSFEVYLFQWPLHTFFIGIGLHTDQNAGQNFITFVLCLYFIAGLYEATLERPFVKWLRAKTEPWLEQQQTTNPLVLR